MKTKTTLALTAAALVALTGCVSMRSNSQRYTSSLMQYLYPDQESHRDKPTIPTLTLPLRVGVAFVPEQSKERFSAAQALSEERKVKLLQEVSDQFRKYPFVKDIEVIPSAYLAPHGGFANLDQLQSMFDVDVIALVSYDQMQFTGTIGWRSFTYLTVIGAFFIPGEANDTRTMLDTAVYDVRSRKLLFRAPGLSEIPGSSSPIDMSEQLRHASEEGFQRASTNLMTNLETQLANFRVRAKERPDEIKIVRSAGYDGGGTVGVPEVIGMLALAGLGFVRWMRRA